MQKSFTKIKLKLLCLLFVLVSPLVTEKCCYRLDEVTFNQTEVYFARSLLCELVVCHAEGNL